MYNRNLPRDHAPRIEILQFLRALAAVSVMAAHAIGDIKNLPNGIDLLPLYYLGAAGVDLFFVISGFVMVYAERTAGDRPDGWAAFAARRCARVIPLYWSVMFLYALLQVAQGKWHVIQPERIVTSALFWPYQSLDGSTLPFYGIGWTLNFEMFFYAVFAFGLFAMRNRAVPFIALLICTLVAAGLIIQLPHPIAYWSDSIVLEFVFGMGVAVAYLNGIRLGFIASASLILLSGAALVLGALYGYVGPMPGEPSAVSRCVAWGLPATAILAALVLRRPQQPREWPTIRLLGDASYSIYLLHPLVIIVSRPAVLGVLDLSTSPAVRFCLAFAAMGLVLVTICILSIISYRWVEAPINSRVRIALREQAQRNLART